MTENTGQKTNYKQTHYKNYTQPRISKQHKTEQNKTSLI